MTFDELKKSTAPFVTAADIAQIIGVGQQMLRGQARENPKMLGFPVTVVGNTVRIPRISFINFVEGEYLKWSEQL